MFKFMLSTTQVFIIMYCSRYLHIFGFIFINQETPSCFFFYIGEGVFQYDFTSILDHCTKMKGASLYS